MADLDVQPKRRSPWPWLLLVLILVVVGIIFFVNRDNDGTVNPTSSPAVRDTSALTDSAAPAPQNNTGDTVTNPAP